MQIMIRLRIFIKRNIFFFIVNFIDLYKRKIKSIIYKIQLYNHQIFIILKKTIGKIC